MFEYNTVKRVRYGETDQMGFLYYGHYAMYYEIGRAESLRSLGYTYRALEERGIMMPVLEFKTKYIRPARYDDLINIVTLLKALPVKNRIVFHTELRSESKELLNFGETTLAFINAKTRKTCEIPTFLTDLFRPYFK